MNLEKKLFNTRQIQMFNIFTKEKEKNFSLTKATYDKT